MAAKIMQEWSTTTITTNPTPARTILGRCGGKNNKTMNEVIFIQQKTNDHTTIIKDYTTIIKVDKSVKKFEVEFNGNNTKVTKVIVELKDSEQWTK